MMSARVRLALLLAGATLYAAILWHTGLGYLADRLREAGWLLAPILLTSLATYLLNAGAMQLVLGVEPDPPRFGRTVAIMISGFAVNYMTPVIAAGGEPLRVLALERWIGRQRAVGAVVLYTMFHAMSSAVLWLAGLLVALLLVPLSGPRLLVLGGATVVVASLLLLLLALHREGLFLRLLGLVRRLPGLRRLDGRLERLHDGVAALDGQIRQFYHEHPTRFLGALALDVASRGVAVFELWLIARGIGLELGAGQAVALAGLGALALNATFFVPFELGSKEASWMAIYSVLGSTGEFAVYASMVGRLKELCWIGIGLALLGPVTGSVARTPEPVGPPVTPRA
jgi:hypothetical protein